MLYDQLEGVKRKEVDSELIQCKYYSYRFSFINCVNFLKITHGTAGKLEWMICTMLFHRRQNCTRCCRLCTRFNDKTPIPGR